MQNQNLDEFIGAMYRRNLFDAIYRSHRLIYGCKTKNLDEFVIRFTEAIYSMQFIDCIDYFKHAKKKLR